MFELDNITSVFQQFITVLITFASKLFPTSQGLPDDTYTAITTIMSSATSFNFIVPMDTLFLIVSYMAIFEVSFLTLRWALWLIKLRKNV